MKDFVGYGDLRRLCKPIYGPSKYMFFLCQLLLEKVMENICFNIFSIFKLQAS